MSKRVKALVTFTALVYVGGALTYWPEVKGILATLLSNTGAAFS